MFRYVLTRFSTLAVLTAVFVFPTLSGYAFTFGGGGPALFYFPGGKVFGNLNNINIPIVDVTNFENGIFAFGGFGYGGVPGMLYGGGFGFGGEREYVTPDGTFMVSVSGGFGTGTRKIDLGALAIHATLGIGVIDFSVARKVNEGNTSVGDLRSGQLEGYLGAEIGYATIATGLGLSIRVAFAELSLGAIMFFGYSFDGWQVNDKKLTGLSGDYSLLVSYSIYGGVGFGF